MRKNKFPLEKKINGKTYQLAMYAVKPRKLSKEEITANKRGLKKRGYKHIRIINKQAVYVRKAK